MRCNTALVLFAILALLGTSSLSAQAPSWVERLAINGFVSTSYSINLNAPPSRTNGYRVFDTRENTMSLDVAELVFRMDPTGAGTGGFRVDLTAGTSVPHVTRSAGWTAEDIDLQQAFATWIAPLGTGLRIDAGKFVTPFGYELIEGYDGFNDNISRSFLFGYAIPFTHTGLRLGYSFSSDLSVTGFVANGWDLMSDNNTAKSVGLQISTVPVSGLTLLVGGATGAERPGNDHDARSLLDASLIWTPSASITVGLNGDFGTEAKAAGDSLSPADASWSGVAAYVRWNLDPRVSLSLRAETFRDPDGYRTGTVQTLTGITLTPEYRPTPGLVLRAELRHDLSDTKVFESDSDPTDQQTTVAFNLLWYF